MDNSFKNDETIKPEERSDSKGSPIPTGRGRSTDWKTNN